MRLITKDLWRAFPELDRFDDDRCRRFVIAAQRGKRAAIWRILLNLILTASVAAAIGSIGLAIMWLFWDAGGGTSGPAAGGWRFAFGLFILCLAIVAAGLSSLVLRDQLLRRRVAHFIFARGKCPQCRYNLLGVRVPESLRIHCPECGLELEVDKALTELADAGTASTESAQHALHAATDDPAAASAPPPLRELHLIRAGEEVTILPRWFTPARRKKAIRLSLLLLALAIVVPSALWAWNQYALHAQAKRAAAQRIGLVGIDKISESLNPPPDGKPDAWDYFERIAAIYFQADREIDAEIQNKYNPHAIPINATPEEITALLSARTPKGYYPDFGAVFSPSEIKYDPYGQQLIDEDAPANLEYAIRLIARMKELGVDEHLRGMASAKRAFIAMPVLAPGAQPEVLLPHLSTARVIVQFLCARMALAAKSGNQTEYVHAFRSALGIVRALERCPLLIHPLVAVSCESLTLETLRRHMEAGLKAETLDAVEAAIRELPTGGTSWTAIMNAERENALEGVRWVFSDIGIIKTAMMPGGWGEMSGRDLPMGTLEQNIAEVDAQFKMLVVLANVPPYRRAVVATLKPRYRVAATFVPGDNRAWWSVQSTATFRAGIRTMLAIERFKAKHTRPPASLDELVPEFLASLPADGYATDSRFRYRVLTASKDNAKPAEYTLYSVGGDFTDNNGACRKVADRECLVPPGKPSTDFVFTPDPFAPQAK